MKIKCQKCQNILFETYNLREFRYEVTCKNCKTKNIGKIESEETLNDLLVHNGKKKIIVDLVPLF